MAYRARNILIAVALAAVAALLTSFYVTSYKRHVQRGEDHVTVLVAKKDIPEGTSGADVGGLLAPQEVPRKARVPGAVSSVDDLAGLVATQPTLEGEQVTVRRFGTRTQVGVRAQLTGTLRAVSLEGDQNQLLAGTLKEGDHVDVVGTWGIKNPGTNGEEAIVSRVVLRNLLVLTAPEGEGGGGSVTNSSSDNVTVQLRVTDAESQKLIWIEKNSNNEGWHLALRPPTGSLDSANTYQDSRLMLFDGPGRRPH